MRETPLKFLIAVAFALVMASTAGASLAGYSHPGLRFGVRQADVSINSYTLAQTPSHVAVWVNVDDGTLSNWLQVGVIAWNNELISGQPTGFCAYLETVVAGKHTLDCVAPAALGEQVAVKLTYSDRHGWVAWVNDVAVGSLGIEGGVTSVAAERFGQASLQYTLNDESPSPKAGATSLDTSTS